MTRFPTFPPPDGAVVGTRRVESAAGFTYVGVLRRGRDILAECGHEHANRSVSTKTNGRSAADCMRDVLHGAWLPAAATAHADGFRNGWLSLTRSTGFVTPKDVIDRAKTSCAERADAYLALVDTVRGLLVSDPGAPIRLTPRPAAAPEPVGDMPDWMC
jgi:hypothetical protein